MSQKFCDKYNRNCLWSAYRYSALMYSHVIIPTVTQSLHDFQNYYQGGSHWNKELWCNIMTISWLTMRWIINYYKIKKIPNAIYDLFNYCSFHFLWILILETSLFANWNNFHTICTIRFGKLKNQYCL